ncbi:MAG: hypothetical protein FWF76_06070 [Oscillospiraceae bacterium]|nr:hypothetical protein [Oscillospiraceae bacterium]
MIQTETRHAEKSSLFKLLLAEYTGDIYTKIAHTKASMEKEDVEDVMNEFEKWKKSKPNNNEKNRLAIC